MVFPNCWILLEASFADIRVASSAIRVLNGDWLRVGFGGSGFGGDTGAVVRFLCLNSSIYRVKWCLK